MPVSEKGKSSRKSEAYPDVMMQTEAKLLSLSRKGRLGENGSSENSAGSGVEPTSLPADCVGFGLSGGGIRSATFCLGFFQGLAKLGLLRKIDFLSTVSGGGYFGSFYTRLFTRKEVDGIDFVENVLDRQGAGKRAEEKKNRPGEEAKPSRLDSGSVFRWLRENGRYLSPNGSGDLLLGGAVLLRNLLAIHIVLGVFFLFQFLLGQGIRTCIAMFTWGRWEGLWKKLDFELIARFPGELFVWVSPFGIFALALLVFWAGPCGWAYWLVGALPQEEQDTNPLLQTIKVRAPFFSLIAIFVAALVTALWPGETGVGSYWQDFLWNPRRFLSTGVVGVAVGALVLVKLANKRAQMLFALEVKKAEKSNVPPENNGLGKYEELFKDNLGRNWLSERLKVALVAVMAVFLYAVIDSFGQTLYLLMKGSADQMKDKSTLVSWIGGVWAALLALSPYVTRIAKALGWSESDTRPSGLKNALLAAVALALAGFILVTFNIASHAIAWKLQRPPVAMKVSKKAPTPARLELTFALVGLAGGDGQKIKYAESSPSVTKEGPAIKAARSKGVLFLTLAFTLVLSILFGHSWPFVNRSSHLPLYSARLIRAYLGASNPLRHDRKRKDGAVTRVMVGDDINTHDYWPWPNPDGEKKDPSSLFKKGTPLHLINVTINETIDGESQIQQQDRKGVGMALGPSGISAGVRHHVVFHEEEGSKEEKEGGRQTAKEQKTTVFPPENDEFRMFDLHKGVFQGERHPIGHWLAISGAAFSTGLGSRTSLGLSLLTGIGNIRLGFWWNSGFDRKKMEENRAEKKREEMKRASAAETSPGEERNKNKKERGCPR